MELSIFKYVDYVGIGFECQPKYFIPEDATDVQEYLIAHLDPTSVKIYKIKSRLFGDIK